MLRKIACASLIPRLNAIICGLGMVLAVCMRTLFENGVLSNGSNYGALEELSMGSV